MQNLQVFEAFNFGAKKGEKKAGINPLFKNNFIDMAVKAFGYKKSGEDKIIKKGLAGECAIDFKGDKITCSICGDYPMTKTKAVDYVKFLVKCEKELNKAPKEVKK